MTVAADPASGRAVTATTAAGPAVERVARRWSSVRDAVVVGAVAITAGGLVAAVTRPTGFALGPWLAAFLVLVGGVAPIALAVGLAVIARDDPLPGAARARTAGCTAGVAVTAAGSLASAPVLTVVGAALLAATLVGHARAVRHAAPGTAALRAAYLGLVAIVVVSLPVGIVLSVLRHA